MPPNTQLGHIEIVLVSPRNPLNIGAVARAMANFGFSNLTVVAPYEPHWREAKSAIGATDLLQKARRTQCLAEAIADCTLVLGTASLTHREPEQPVVELPDVAPLLRDEFTRGGRIAIVFGPEKRGLTREDLALCHRLLTIPADSVQPSMNLGQAAAVCLYEIATRLNPPQILGAPGPGSPRTGLRPRGGDPSHLGTWEIDTPTNSARITQLAQIIDETMQAADYSPVTMRAANRHDTHLLLRRLNLNGNDARRILGFLRRVLWRLRH